MENQVSSFDALPLNPIGESRLELDEEDFRSCCGDEEVWLKESDDMVKVAEEKKDELDEFSAKMFFKGVSMSQGGGDSGSGSSGIGVILERSADFAEIKVQKRLDFYAEGSVAEYLALMDGLVVALQNNICRVFAATDSELLYNQIMREEKLENPLLVALRERILEHTSNLETFVLNLVPPCDLEQSLNLAHVAIGMISSSVDGSDESVENCTVCCEDRLSLMMITFKCTHRFCSLCMKTYVDGKVQSSQVPIRCPQPRCKYYVSTAECKTFLPVSSYELFSKALEEANVRMNDKIYCPYPNCSVLIDPHECLSGRASSSSQSEGNCIECPACERFVCVECGVPWHSSMSCVEFQNLPVEERDAADITLHRLALNKRWRRCQQCRRMIELIQGCYHMTCWCGHEFCYSCGAEYRNGQQACHCAFWEEDQVNSDEESSAENSVHETEQWPWDTFSSFPIVMDAYTEQEHSQLALIQRFLAGGFSLSDHHTYQSPPRCTESSYVEAAMKDLHQLPWLERFVSVISDDYYEEYNQ
ncbi:PREDICTED: uncharacterized protein LOC104811473 [Tarenaya hassleriana]|uniref:uncharacterized protein LOC104811473 n=1 Tax=Tarenaya hassleriana TaxID=28532 RepID=UPI00053C48C0|nr:PREDICTED: uncharacterized protein LOC104811473 [Tarenaya hassleriana]XP_010536497.1 PREDICTED: uncharacterized protein LOC104811473 [Tarenaya hassleriana]